MIPRPPPPQPQPQESRALPSGWVVPALGLAALIGQLSVLGLGPFLPVMADAFDTSIALLGQVPAGITLLAAVFALAVGPVADWLGHRRALLLGLATTALGTLGIALAPNLVVLLAVALVGAVGRATINPICQAIAGTRYTGETRRRALGWVVAGASGAGFVGIPFLTGIDAVLGWRAAFGGLTLLVLASLLLAGVVLTPERAAVTGPPRAGALLRSYTPLLGHGPTRGLIGATVLGAMGMWTMWTYLGAFYVQRHGFTTQQAGWAYMLAALGVVPGTLAIGGRLGRLPLRPLLVGSRLVTGVLQAAALMLPVTSVVAVGLMMLSAVVTGMGVVVTSTLLTSETPGGRATTMGLNQAAISLGTALGSALGRLLLALSGYGALGLSALLWCCASAGVVWWSRAPALPRRVPASPLVGKG